VQSESRARSDDDDARPLESIRHTERPPARIIFERTITLDVDVVFPLARRRRR
jgi:hypothetical protein